MEKLLDGVAHLLKQCLTFSTVLENVLDVPTEMRNKHIPQVIYLETTGALYYQRAAWAFHIPLIVS